ncbi:MAG: hypothetical protein IAE90_07255 [Ignavibacteria bacterium]|nr:hypothetical protein [Ignavibacteria bacterium]
MFHSSHESAMPLPEELKVPEEMVYCYMIHFLAKLYGKSPGEAAKLTQFDFMTAILFEQLEHRKQKYYLELHSTENL